MRQQSRSALMATAFLVVSAAGIQSAAARPSAAQQDRNAPGPAHETKIVVGEVPPTRFTLNSIDGEAFDLASAEGPLLLLFFRGTW